MIAGRYDGQLQMYCEAAREPDLTRLHFLRWLAERGYLEHDIAGTPSGPLALVTRLEELVCQVRGPTNAP